MFKTFKSTYSLYIILGLSLIANSLEAQNCSTDPLANASTPASRFIDHGNGTVTDNKTGLMWQKCADGQYGALCDQGSPATYTWQNALQRAKSLNSTSGFANYADWRMPNIKELYSLVEITCAEPAINLAIFPSTINGLEDHYWSSTPMIYTNYGQHSRTVTFYDGSTDSRYKTENGLLRLVREPLPEL